ncbi:hypothetical protein A0H81_02252 [Grifola frondosa]|uniref:Uncharacterized protein n=1 Tax=Grifola frondosa TaxID=5627 RepID=A0A1C7MLI4_GRIFR|nr:hypothetical protein A0H81_02252 [Grifola frondosa]
MVLKRQFTMIEPLPIPPDIIVALHFISATPPLFHWMLYVQSNVEDGFKFHATQTNNRNFVYEKASFTLCSSRRISAAAVVGRLNTHTLCDLHNILKRIPVNIIPHVDIAREPQFSCRVWVREAVRRLHAEGFLDCPDVDALEQEMWHYGRISASEIRRGVFTKATLYTALSARAT